MVQKCTLSVGYSSFSGEQEEENTKSINYSYINARADMEWNGNKSMNSGTMISRAASFSLSEMSDDEQPVRA